MTNVSYVVLTSRATALVQPFTFAAFWYATAFNSDISGWDVSKVTTLADSKSSHPVFVSLRFRDE